MNTKYIPALGFDWLTPLYDPLMKWLMRESWYKIPLVRRAHIETGHHVLDLGCGTGTLTILIKQTHPGAVVVGLDADAKALDIAGKKAAGEGVEIAFHRGMMQQLPYADHSFDRILSSLALHHLDTENKRRALGEASRVLRPGNSSNPPATVPPYMAVVVSSSVQKSGPVISGNAKRVIVVRTDPGYGPAPGHRGTGQVVAILCTAP